MHYFSQKDGEPKDSAWKAGAKALPGKKRDDECGTGSLQSLKTVVLLVAEEFDTQHEEDKPCSNLRSYTSWDFPNQHMVETQ